MEEIVINENLRHGKPVIKGTRITVDEVLRMLEGGMSYEEIEREYRLTKEQIISAIKYASSFIRGEEIRKTAAEI